MRLAAPGAVNRVQATRSLVRPQRYCQRPFSVDSLRTSRGAALSSFWYARHPGHHEVCQRHSQPIIDAGFFSAFLRSRQFSQLEAMDYPFLNATFRADSELHKHAKLEPCEYKYPLNMHHIQYI